MPSKVSHNDSDAKEEIILGAGEADSNEVIDDSEGDEASSVGDIANDEGDIEVVNREQVGDEDADPESEIDDVEGTKIKNYSAGTEEDVDGNGEKSDSRVRLQRQET